MAKQVGSYQICKRPECELEEHYITLEHIDGIMDNAPMTLTAWLDDLYSKREILMIDSAKIWADQKKNVEQFSYDADREADTWWEKEGQYTVGRIKSSKM